MNEDRIKRGLGKWQIPYSSGNQRTVFKQW